MLCVVGWGVCLCFFVLFFTYLSQFPSFSFLLSLFPSLFFPSSLFFPLFSFLFLVFSSLPFTPPNTVERTDQPTRRPTSRHLNVIWRTAGAQQSVLSPPPLHSLLPSLPLLLKKKGGTFYFRNISGEEFNFYDSLKLIPKNRRRAKLQTLQFHINSKTIELQRVKTVIIFAEMVVSGVSISRGAQRVSRVC